MDAKPASACPKQMDSQINWLQFQRNAGNLSVETDVEPRLVTGVPQGAAPHQPSLCLLQPVGQRKGGNRLGMSMGPYPLLLLPCTICFRLFCNQESGVDY